MFGLFRKIDPKASEMIQYMENHPTGDIFGDSQNIVFFDGFHLGFSRDSNGKVRTIFLNEPSKPCVEIFNNISTKKEIKALEKARVKALHRSYQYESEMRELKRVAALKNLKVNP